MTQTQTLTLIYTCALVLVLFAITRVLLLPGSEQALAGMTTGLFFGALIPIIEKAIAGHKERQTMAHYTGTLISLVPDTTPKGQPKANFTLETENGTYSGRCWGPKANQLTALGQGAHLTLKGYLSGYATSRHEKGGFIIESIHPNHIS